MNDPCATRQVFCLDEFRVESSRKLTKSSDFASHFPFEAVSFPTPGLPGRLNFPPNPRGSEKRTDFEETDKAAKRPAATS